MYLQWEYVGENKFFTSAWLLVEDSFWVREEGLCLPSQHWESILCSPVKVLYMLPTIYEFICMLCPTFHRGYCFLGVLHSLWLLLSFCIFFHRVHWVLRKEIEGKIPFKIECSKFLTFFTLSSCGCLYIFPSTIGGSVSGDGWANHWCISIAEFCHKSFYGCISPA